MAASVADLCLQEKVSVDELTERSGLDAARVLAIVMGRWTPSPQERQKIAQAFGIPVDEIRWGHNTPVQHIYGQGPG